MAIVKDKYIHNLKCHSCGCSLKDEAYIQYKNHAYCLKCKRGIENVKIDISKFIVYI